MTVPAINKESMEVSEKSMGVPPAIILMVLLDFPLNHAGIGGTRSSEALPRRSQKPFGQIFPYHIHIISAIYPHYIHMLYPQLLRGCIYSPCSHTCRSSEGSEPPSCQAFPEWATEENAMRWWQPKKLPDKYSGKKQEWWLYKSKQMDKDGQHIEREREKLFDWLIYWCLDR